MRYHICRVDFAGPPILSLVVNHGALPSILDHVEAGAVVQETPWSEAGSSHNFAHDLVDDTLLHNFEGINFLKVVK